MYSQSQDPLRTAEHDATQAGSGRPTRANRGKLACSQTLNIVAHTTNPDISFEKAGVLNNTLFPGSLEGPGREAIATIYIYIYIYIYTLHMFIFVYNLL